jgi:hypothetical protein
MVHVGQCASETSASLQNFALPMTLGIGAVIKVVTPRRLGDVTVGTPSATGLQYWFRFQTRAPPENPLESYR